MFPKSIDTDSYFQTYAFSGCSSLTSIEIPEGVARLFTFSFANCTSLTTITLPSTIQELGNPNAKPKSPFYGCDNLSCIKTKMKQPITITADIFPNYYKSILYVPEGCKATYEVADYWNEFKEIIEIN